MDERNTNDNNKIRKYNFPDNSFTHTNTISELPLTLSREIILPAESLGPSADMEAPIDGVEANDSIAGVSAGVSRE